MNKNLLRVWMARAVFACSVIMIVFLRIESFNLYFLSGLLLVLLLTIAYRRGLNRSTVACARILLGAVFVFSGFVKGVDPLGTQYQIEDYFFAYGTAWAEPFALPLSLALNALEFTVGVMLILNIRIRLMSWIVALMMLCFTGVTLYDALYSPVPDCGCFGKALVLTNWQTFYKNLILDSWVLVLWLGYFLQRPRKRWLTESSIMLGVAALFIGFQVYSLKHLPCIEFMEWKVGRVVMPPRTEPILYYSTYRNLQTGEKREYLSKDIPMDSQFHQEWAFDTIRIEDPNPRGVSIALFSSYGQTFPEEVTELYLGQTTPHIALVAWDIKKARTKGLKTLLAKLSAQPNDWALLTSSSPAAIDSVLRALGYDPSRITILEADDTSLKTVIRSNPGVVLFNKGAIVKKWAWRDMPEAQKLQTYIKP